MWRGEKPSKKKNHKKASTKWKWNIKKVHRSEKRRVITCQSGLRKKCWSEGKEIRWYLLRLQRKAPIVRVCVCGVFMAAAEIFPVFMLCYYFSWPALKLSTKTMKTRSRKIKLVLRGCCSFCLLLGLLGSASVEGSPSVTTSPQQEMKHFLVCLQRCWNSECAFLTLSCVAQRAHVPIT